MYNINTTIFISHSAAASARAKSVGWANHNFNNLQFDNAIETSNLKPLEMGIEATLSFSQLLRRRLLKL